ncbi:hypothetical protein FA13DRAFT_1628436, partial [Coprinellus micaceus]
NDYMKDWLHIYQKYLNVVLDAQAPPSVCQSCDCDPADYRCLECVGNSYLCWGCCRDAHVHTPLHRVEAWTGSHFEPSWLWPLGIGIYLGHGGDLCPQQTPLSRPSDPPAMPALDDHSYGAKPKGRKLEGHSVCVVVHTNGVHHLPFVRCKCSDAEPFDIQLIRAGFYPSTEKEPRTVFSVPLLNLYLVETLECRTATNNFYSKLRRLTNETFPHSVPDRYRELLRAGRQWRHLSELASFGFANNGQHPGEGELALFCAACPQPGINLPKGWEKDPNQWLYVRFIILDGNFVCVHRLLRGQEGDTVYLKPAGEGYMTAPGPYMDHVHSTAEAREVSKCYNHRAIADRGKAHKGCDVSGIGAAACRHGAFYPTSVGDFQKGERYLNMDYILTKAVKFGRTAEAPRLVCLYDINCQYPVNVYKRMAAKAYLLDTDTLDKFTWGIGTWHVHGHKNQCLARYSPSFIPGVGTTTGEILESLWALTNDTGRMSSIMTLAHRIEAMDAAMLESNRQKMLGLVGSLSGKLLQSRIEWNEARADFEALSAPPPNATDDERKKWWKKQMEKAEEGRRNGKVKAMDVYNIKYGKQQIKDSGRHGPTEPVGIVKWVSLGIQIGEDQQRVIQRVRKYGKSPSDSEALEIAKLRERLVTRYQEYYNLGESLFPLVDIHEINTIPLWGSTCSCDEEDCPHPADREIKGKTPGRASLNTPESEVLLMASTTVVLPVGWGAVRTAELELRKAQALGCLEQIRIEVGHKSFLFRSNKNLKLGDGKTGRLRGYAAIASANRVINLYRSIYHHARSALSKLKAEPALLAKLQLVQPNDVKPLLSVYLPNARNQRNKPVPWLWALDAFGDITNTSYLAEVHRVNWIRARSRALRWEEEHQLTTKEMEFTMNYFEYTAGMTRDWGKGLPQSPSQNAWSSRCSAVWTMLKVHAETQFSVARSSLAEYLAHGQTEGDGDIERDEDIREDSGSDWEAFAADDLGMGEPEVLRTQNEKGL